MIGDIAPPALTLQNRGGLNVPGVYRSGRFFHSPFRTMPGMRYAFFSIPEMSKWDI